MANSAFTQNTNPIGGANTQVQFNDGGNFGGDATFTFNKTTDVLTAPYITASTSFSGSGVGISNLNGSNINSGFVGTAYGGCPAGLMFTGGRLSLSGSSVADVSSSSTIYYVPHTSNACSVYDTFNGGIRPNVFSTFGYPSITLSGLTTGRNYDVFAYANSGTFTLILSTVWVDNSTRTNAISLSQYSGGWERADNNVFRYLGTFRATSATTTTDTPSQRFLYNAYNQVPRKILRQETAGGWSYTSGTWRAYNNSAANRVEFVQGIATHAIDVSGQFMASSSSGATASVGISVDAVATPSQPYIGQIGGGGTVYNRMSTSYRYCETLAPGYHYLQMMESGGTGVDFFAGGSGNGVLTGTFWC